MFAGCRGQGLHLYAPMFCPLSGMTVSPAPTHFYPPPPPPSPSNRFPTARTATALQPPATAITAALEPSLQPPPDSPPAQPCLLPRPGVGCARCVLRVSGRSGEGAGCSAPAPLHPLPYPKPKPSALSLKDTEASAADGQGHQWPTERVFLHPASVNFKARKYGRNWLVYHDIAKTSKVFVRDCTEVWGCVLEGVGLCAMGRPVLDFFSARRTPPPTLWTPSPPLPPPPDQSDHCGEKPNLQ